MKADNVAKLRRKLVRAVNCHLKAGGQLKSGGFGKDNCLCPLSCLVEGNWDGMLGSADILSQKLGFKMTDEDLWQFVDGFDLNVPSKMSALFKLGRSLREKYIEVLNANYAKE